MRLQCTSFCTKPAKCSLYGSTFDAVLQPMSIPRGPGGPALASEAVCGLPQDASTVTTFILTAARFAHPFLERTHQLALPFHASSGHLLPKESLVCGKAFIRTVQTAATSTTQLSWGVEEHQDHWCRSHIECRSVRSTSFSGTTSRAVATVSNPSAVLSRFLATTTTSKRRPHSTTKVRNG